MAKRRRGHGEGSVCQRNDGYWTAAVEAGRCPGGHLKKDGTTCKGGERRRARIVRRTKKAVLDELDQLKRRGIAGIAGKDPTVDEWLTWWIDTVKAPTLGPTSLADYPRWHRDRISPHIGYVRLRKLTTADVRHMLARLEAAGIGPKARNTTKTVLSGALKHAVGERVVIDNVAAHVTGAKIGARLDDALDQADLNDASMPPETTGSTLSSTSQRPSVNGGRSSSTTAGTTSTSTPERCGSTWPRPGAASEPCPWWQAASRS